MCRDSFTYVHNFISGIEVFCLRVLASLVVLDECRESS
jgi:hypothetical protein